ncbi:MAG: hypothetical protein ACJ786_30045 [Catenulispora sp.]
MGWRRRAAVPIGGARPESGSALRRRSLRPAVAGVAAGAAVFAAVFAAGPAVARPAESGASAAAVQAAGTANGTPLEPWTCNSGSNQKWTLR